MHKSVSWRMSVNFTSGWNELIIWHVTHDDSGDYSCHEVDNFDNMVNFHLAVKGMSFHKIIK